MLKRKNSIPEVMMQSPFWMLLSVLLAAVSAAAFFIQYIAIYRLISEIVPKLSCLETVSIALVRKCGLFAFVGAAVNIACYFGSLSASHLGAFDIAYNLRKKFSEHISTIPLGAYMSEGSGKMQNLLYNSINEIQSYLAHEVPEIVMAILSPLFLFALMLMVNVWYSLALCIAVACAYFFNAKSYSYAEGGGKKMMDIYLSALDDLNNESNEFVRGISVIKVFGQKNHASRRLNDSIRRYSDGCIPYTIIWEKYRCIFSGMMSNLYLALFPVAYAILCKNGAGIDFATDLIVFLLITPSLAVVIPKMEGISNGAVKVEMAIDRMNRILDIAPLEESVHEAECESNDVEFNYVSFSYDGNTPVLRDISFSAKEGSVTAVVGPSGGGKSTIAGLMARFWDADKGSITIGGTDIRNLKTQTLMKKVSFVFQDTFLFNQSAAENIRANSGASLEDVINAAKAARCHDFIMKLPLGYDTVLGSARKLSGGEKQRIAIARAIIKDAPIIVLDEATASTDPENEYEIQLALGNLSKNKTLIMIAHRLSNVKSADKILFVERGEIVESGTHDELIERNGRYKEMWDIYLENVNWKLR